MKAYKVFRRDLETGELTSVGGKTGVEWQDYWTITYQPGIVNYPKKHSKLFIFTEPERARSMKAAMAHSLDAGGSYEVWEVEAGDEIVFLERMIPLWRGERMVKDFWRYWHMDHNGFDRWLAQFELGGYVTMPIEGTFVCDWVQPVKELK